MLIFISVWSNISILHPQTGIQHSWLKSNAYLYVLNDKSYKI